MKREIVIGTRESQLAMWQARWVLERLKALYPQVSFTLRGIKTSGDRFQEMALNKIGDKGLFTKELELALQQKEIDLAVHSMKDLPTSLPDGLTIGAICPREYPGDVLVSRSGRTLDELPRAALVGTSSTRRTAQLRHYRPDLRVTPVRGNVTTRLRKLEELSLDALVLAYAGLHRLGLDHLITQRLPYHICLPAVGQGAIGVEVRAEDGEVLEMVRLLDDPSTRAAVTAERSFLRELEGGCQVPVGALGEVEDGYLTLEGMVATQDGSWLLRDKTAGPLEQAESLGRELAAKLMARGAKDVLQKARQEIDGL